MPDVAPTPTPKKLRKKADFSGEIARLRALPHMQGVADKLEEAVSDMTEKRAEFIATRKRARKMLKGVASVEAFLSGQS